MYIQNWGAESEKGRKNMINIKIALPNKGRLKEPSEQLLQNIGIEFSQTERSLFARAQNFNLDIMYASTSDIPEYVQDRVVDLGITGLDLVKEKNAKIKVLSPLNFGFATLVVGIPTTSKITSVSQLNNKKIATVFPNLSREYLKKVGIKAKVVEVSGAAEIAPTLGLADAIIDLTSSGNTLKTNGLNILDNVFQSEAVLIACPHILKNEKIKEDIDIIMLRIESVLMAHKKRYIMMNASEKILPKIKNVAPGLSSPTIMPLAKPGMIAVHSVVDAHDVWRVVAELKKIGASGILVAPIEKMVL